MWLINMANKHVPCQDLHRTLPGSKHSDTWPAKRLYKPTITGTAPSTDALAT